MRRPLGSRRRLGVAVAVAVILLGALGWAGLYAAVALSGFGGTSLTERDLSHEDQVAWINQFSPVAVSSRAADIHLKYQRFQDWYFEASFTLPEEEFQAFTGALQPLPGSAGQSPSRTTYAGKRIGSWVGRVDVDAQTRRVWVHHVSS